MIVYHFPPEAQNERACFGVAGQTYPDSAIAGELMIVPHGASAEEAFDGAIFFFPAPPDVTRVPISAGTLLPTALCDVFPENPLFVSSQITSGTLRTRLEENISRHGARLWLLIDPYCAVFPLPCPDGQGQRISRAASAILRAEHKPQYTDAFCCNYCVPVPPSGALHLYDTRQTISEKLALAAEIGVQNVLVLSLFREDGKDDD